MLRKDNIEQNVFIKIINKHKIENDNQYLNPYLTLRKSVKNVRLRSVQYKLLHNIYPTMKHLFTWKIKQTPNCGACGEIETIEHATYRCEMAKNTFVKVAEVLNINLPTYETVVLGSSSTGQYELTLSKKESYGLDNVLIGIKQKLILQRENKVELSQDEVRNTIKLMVKIEKFNATKTHNLKGFKEKWGWIDTLLEN